MTAAVSDRSRARETFVSLSAAAYGLGVAISLLPFWLRPARPGQLPSFMTLHGYDAHASFRFIVCVLLLPVAASLAARPLARWLGRRETQLWVAVIVIAALLSAPWSAVLSQQPAWVALPPLALIAIAVALRNVRARFTRRDVMLVPVVLTVYLALLDAAPSLEAHHAFQLAAFSVLALRLLISFGSRSRLAPDFAFVFAPLGLALQSHFNGYHQRHSPWLPLAIAFVTPPLLRYATRNRPATRRRLRSIAAFVVMPIAAMAYASATSFLAVEGAPHGDLFENAHQLVPASEMMRGEKLYRDIIPAHGLMQDGLLDYLILRTGPVTAGHALETHGVLGTLNRAAGYALGAAITGSMEVGILGWLAGVLLGTGGGSIRPLTAIVVIALIAVAVRRRRPRWFAAAGVLAVAALLTSVDFGFYAFVALAVALVRLRGSERRKAVLAAGIGTAAAAAITLVAMALFGVAADFVRTTFVELPALGAVYALSPFEPTEALRAARSVPEVIAAFFDHASWLYLFWIGVLLAWATAVAAPHRGATRRGRIREALVPVLTFAAIAVISYSERQHLYFQYVAGALVAAAIYSFWRSRSRLARWGAVAAMVVALLVAAPTAHVLSVAMLRRSNGPLDPTTVRIDEIPRARGVLYKPLDAALIRGVNDYVQRELQPDETFFDFTNRGGLYFLLDRDCPLRELEVAFYETPAAQREVIARLAMNPRVRIALMPPLPIDGSVDGVPNEVRAPLVFAWVQKHFRPQVTAGGVQIWRRID